MKNHGKNFVVAGLTSAFIVSLLSFVGGCSGNGTYASPRVHVGMGYRGYYGHPWRDYDAIDTVDAIDTIDTIDAIDGGGAVPMGGSMDMGDMDMGGFDW
ncbi:MAG: hypothetical protein V7744_20285 [Pseudomonadales bacterium]